jgi:hypothetical protein
LSGGAGRVVQKILALSQLDRKIETERAENVLARKARARKTARQVRRIRLDG